MIDLDDLPKRDDNFRIQVQSETAFELALATYGVFVSQSKDNYDNGTDYLIEAGDAGVKTNVRVHVQLKGTDRKSNTDDSVSVSITKRNLNYLALQPGSIFVCFHIPSQRLLVRRVDDVIREYEHTGFHRSNQKTVTVRFKDEFDQDFQKSLNEYVIASAKGARNYRTLILTQPPENIPSIVEEGAKDLPVPADRKQAEEMLSELYGTGHDNTISQSFEKFRAVLGHSNEKFMFAYMAEINLGINGQECDKSRIAEGIEVIKGQVDGKLFSPGSLLYCVGNGWQAISEYEKARDAYISALNHLDEAVSPEIVARCCKNLGTTMEKMNKPDAAYALYTRALELAPNLSEAHFALALWYNRHDVEPERSLIHLDAIRWPANSAGTNSSVHAWRAEILFKLGKPIEAFRDIHALLAEGDKLAWAWPWSARLVATYGRTSVDSAEGALKFWNTFVTNLGDELMVRREQLLCIWYLRINGGSVECDYEEFKQNISDIVDRGVMNPAFLWDRVGHWAQDEGDWSEAENCYRKAFELSSGEYGYCLGTALNFLGRYPEALPILLQAKEHQPDAMSWFQIAIAREGIGDLEESITAYKRALKLDEDYELAWFNLGGVYWNSLNKAKAISTWKEAIQRFPTHQLSSKLQKEFPILQTQ